MRRVVVTGLGIVSSIGSNAQEVLASLREGKSGISFAPDYAEHGFRSQVHGKPDVDIPSLIDKRQLRFMGDGAAYNYIAMQQAIADLRRHLALELTAPATANFAKLGDQHRHLTLVT